MRERARKRFLIFLLFFHFPLADKRAWPTPPFFFSFSLSSLAAHRRIQIGIRLYATRWWRAAHTPPPHRRPRLMVVGGSSIFPDGCQGMSHTPPPFCRGLIFALWKNIRIFFRVILFSSLRFITHRGPPNLRSLLFLLIRLIPEIFIEKERENPKNQETKIRADSVYPGPASISTCSAFVIIPLSSTIPFPVAAAPPPMVSNRERRETSDDVWKETQLKSNSVQGLNEKQLPATSN